jgi:hypothetical protein
LDIKRNAMQFFSAEEQRAVSRWERRRFQTSKSRYEIRNAVFYKLASGSGVGHRGLTRNRPPVKPIPRHAIANRRRECRLGKGNESHQSMDTMKPLLHKLYFWAVPAKGAFGIIADKYE